MESFSFFLESGFSRNDRPQGNTAQPPGTGTRYQPPEQQRRPPVHATQAYRQGIQRGHENEKDIRKETLTSCGWELVPVTNSQLDMRRGIDAYLRRDGQQFTVQLKTRKQGVGSDLGYEVASDRSANDQSAPPSPTVMLRRLNGRDMRTEAHYTALLDQSGAFITLFATHEGHDLIQQGVEDWLRAIQYFGHTPRGSMYLTKFQHGPVNFVYRWDTRDLYWKIMCYIKPEAMKSFETCKLKNTINTSYGA